MPSRRWWPVGLLAGLALVAAAREVSVVILHTTDLHGRLVNLIPETGVAPEAGFLRIATLIRAVRAAHPSALYIDCGDTIQGTPESLASRGRILVEAIARAGCDAWVPGNHEFDWGAGAFRELLPVARMPVLAANLAPRGGAPPLPGVRPWILRDVDGVRVAIVGVTHPTTPLWVPPPMLDGLAFEAPEKAIAAVLPDLRKGGADLRVLALHDGLWAGRTAPAPGAIELSRRFPEFDVVLGGHTHEAVAAMELPGGALYSQAGWHGQHLGRVDLVYDTVRRRVVRRSATLMPADATVEPDPDLAAAFGATIERTARELDRRLATVEGIKAVDGGLPGDEPAARFLRRAIAEMSGAEVVIHGRLSDTPLTDGDMTLRDLWRLVPYDNRIAVCRLTPGEIRVILEEALAQPAGRPVAGISGLLVDLEGQGPDRRVASIALPDGSSPHARRRFRVALNGYALASAGGRLPQLRRLAFQPEAALELTTIDTRDAARAWAERRRRIRPEDLGPPGYRTIRSLKERVAAPAE